MHKSAVDEIPLPSPTSLQDEVNNDQQPPTDSSLSTEEPEPIAITLNPSAVCFTATSQDYNLDWPALPGSGGFGTSNAPDPEVVPLSSTPPENDKSEVTFDLIPDTTTATDDNAESNDIEVPAENDPSQEDPQNESHEYLPEGHGAVPSTDSPPMDNDSQEQPSSPPPPLSDQIIDNSHFSFNLYQRQANIYSEANLNPYPSLIHAHHSAPAIQPGMEVQGQFYFNLGHHGHGSGGADATYSQPSIGIQMMPMPNFLPSQPPPPLPPPPLQFQNQTQGMHHHHHTQPHQMRMNGNQHHHPHQDNNPNFQAFNVIVPQPVYYGVPEQEKVQQNHHQQHCCGGESASGQCQCQIGTGAFKEEKPLLEIKIPSWAKLNFDEAENSCLYPLSSSSRSSSRPRLVEYIGDQYHEKNPHTRRTILLNQRRSSDNDPIVFYRFYQFSCPCQGKVWFSPLHRAREGCYCRDCHKFVKPFGHIDGLTPYMGHELCYAKFQCHQCGRSWSCQKSRSNFPDNCFSCGSIVYPYYQVSHSVLRRKIVRQNDSGTVQFRNMTYSASSTSLEDDEEYQEILGELGQRPLYFEQGGGGSPSSSSSPTTDVESNKTSSDGSASARSKSFVCLGAGQGQGQPTKDQSLFGGNALLSHSISDTVVVLGHHPHQRWSRSEALHFLGLGIGSHGRGGVRPHHHRK